MRKMYNLEEKDELQCFKSFGKKVKLLDIFIYYTKMFNLIDEKIYRIYCFQNSLGGKGDKEETTTWSFKKSGKIKIM